MRVNPRKKRATEEEDASPRSKSLKRKRADPEKYSRRPKSPDLLDVGDNAHLRKLRKLRDKFAGVKESLDELKDREKDLKDQIASLCADSGLPNGFRDGEAAGISIFQSSQSRISGASLLNEGVDSSIIQRCTTMSEFRVVRLSKGGYGH